MSLAHQEDVASVLATWINDAANLPAELAYLFDELAAKDKLFLEHTTLLEARDASLQKFIRQNGSLIAHPKEQQYADQVRASYEKALQVQAEKMKLAEKALELVGRYEKRLVGKMKGLYKDGLLAEDPSPPAVTTVVVGGQRGDGGMQSPARQRATNVAGTNLPLATPVIQAAINAPGTLGPTDKALKRRVTLNTATTPAARDSTPTASILPPPPRKASEDPAPSQSRAGSTSARGTPAPPGKLKRSLSNAPPSRKGTLGSRKRLKKPPTHNLDGEPSGSIILGDGTGAQTVEEEDDGADDRKYCFCKQVSYGDMVGCDNDSCRYEWFHWGCVGIEKEPIGKWYCDECRVNLGK